jgi:uncharacterized SAM-binding protein YcdF (DUF218 family)
MMPAMRTFLMPWLLPPGGPLLLMLAGLLLWRRRIGRWLAATGLLAALLLSLPAVVDGLARLYIGDAGPRDLQAELADWRGRSDSLVLVLGAGVRVASDARGAYDLKPLTAERLRRGLWWSRQLGLPLGFSGGVSPRAEPGAPSEADTVVRVLAELGLPPLALAESLSIDTRSNASQSAILLRQRGIRRLLLVTDDLHMPRALRHFRAALPEAEVVAAPLGQRADDDWRLSDWLPSSEAARRGAYLAYELAARLVGH